jgi:hypothetical protein
MEGQGRTAKEGRGPRKEEVERRKRPKEGRKVMDGRQ